MNEGFQHPKPKSPWAVEPGSPVDVLQQARSNERKENEFAKKTLGAFRVQLKELSSKDGITYEVEEENESMLLSADREQFSPFLQHINTLLHEANELLQSHNKTFRLHAHVKGMHAVRIELQKEPIKTQ